MASNTPQSPTPDGYASVKTPEGHALAHEAKSGVSPWSGRYRFVGNAAQLLLVASMVVYAFGQVAYFTPVYSNDISGTLKFWWGVSTEQTARGGGAPAVQGNSSMGGGQGNSTVGGGRSNSTMGVTRGQGNSTAVSGGRQGNNSMTVSSGRQGNSSVGGGQAMDSGHGGHGRRALSSDVWVAMISDGKAVTPVPAPSPAPSPRPTPTPAGGGGQTVKKGHSEMVLPTYFFLFSILPLFVSGLLIEFLRHFNVRRISSHYVLKLAMVLRRKPVLFGRVSYWSYGEWIFFWALVGGNVYVFYRYFSTRITGMKARSKNGLKFNTYLETIGLTFGYSCIFNLAFLFLPATRNCAWMEFFNISYANGIKYHRWLGIVTVLTGVLHTAGYYWSWLRQGTWKRQSLPCFDCNIAERKGYKVWFNVFGEIALLIFLVIGLTSIPYVRRKLYNVFYYSHQLLFLAVIFSVMHWASIVWWIFPTFLIYCFSRAMSMSSNFSPIEVKELTAIDSDIVKIVLKRSPGRDGHYHVGQFLYLNVPAISKLQWHAFTIASSPRTSPTTVTVLLKSLGDWTRDLAIHANECKEKNVLPTVYVDGFYGASLELYDEYSTVLLVGGGIGATPMFAILEDLVAKLDNHQMLQQKVVFVFSFRELALLEEIHPVLARLRELDPREQYFKTHFYLTRLPSEEVLARRVDTDRLQGKHIQPMTYAPATSTPMAFTEPLRSRTYRALAFTTVVAIGLLLLVYLEFGGGKVQRGTNRYLWPLQQFVDPSMAMVAACAVFPFVLAERISKRKSASATGASKQVELNVFQSVGTPALMISDVHTYRDLLSHYNVVLGERPNTETIVQDAYNIQNDRSVSTYGKPTIGVFVSGPDAMKRAVECAVHGVGASHFDIHDEEFEL